MRPTPIPDDEIWEGGRRLVVSPPGGDLTNPDIAPVEAIADRSHHPDPDCTGCVTPEDRRLWRQLRQAHMLTPEPVSPHPDQTLEDLQIEASGLATKVSSYWEQVSALRDSRQPAVSFIPDDVRAAMGRAYLAEKREIRAAQAAGYPGPIGASTAPLNIEASELHAEIRATLDHQRRRIVRFYLEHGLCLTPRRLHLPSVSDRRLAWDVRDLVWRIPHKAMARTVVRELQDLATRATKLIEPEERRRLPGVCPHCRRSSLVIYRETGLVQCERGRGQPCRCSDQLCGCQLDPVKHTHRWYRDRKATAPDSWQALAGRINLRNLARKKTP